MLIHIGLSLSLWPKAIAAVCYIINCLPTKTRDSKTLYKAWYKKKSNLTNLYIYGCNTYLVYYHVRSKSKMALHSWIEILVEYKGKN